MPTAFAAVASRRAALFQTRGLVARGWNLPNVPIGRHLPGRCLASSSNDDPTRSDPSVSAAAASAEWRKSQLNKIEEKFGLEKTAGPSSVNGSATNEATESTRPRAVVATEEPLKIESDEDLQPMWKDMESRVTRRRPLTVEQRGGKVGRRNVRKSDEDMWLQAGLYDDDNKSSQ
uniref:Uncharacterized protein n=1 Tax=Pseudictyota dubia TaxID=2749911 RepID=A0A7R9W6L0_9STRA|mmetsp:Transcript_36128/g.66660  ORF Transcript_36128/g.66660 Transcript_36128/m.66660 type:complete len:175 (+) Transcript_36128:229-753(+)